GCRARSVRRARRGTGVPACRPRCSTRHAPSSSSFPGTIASRLSRSPWLLGRSSRPRAWPPSGAAGSSATGRACAATSATSAVAAALAACHALRVPGIERCFRPQDDLAVVEPWVALVRAVFPELAASLEGCLTDVRMEVPRDDPGRASLVHRDFYDKQILVAP